MEDCIFCKIVKGDIPSKKVYEDDDVYAFEDIQPQAPVHVLVIPKKHIAALQDAKEDDWPLFGNVQRAAQTVARQLGVEQSGYRVVTNNGKDAGQVVFHIHYHLLAGEKLGPLNGKS